MGTPVVLTRFDSANPPTPEAINANFEALVATINALAADSLLQFGVSPGNPGNYMPVTGGEFAGQISSPSVLIGPPGGPKAEAVTTARTATTGATGLVKMALAVADLAQSISNPPTQAEVTAIQNKLNALLAQLRAAGLLSGT